MLTLKKLSSFPALPSDFVEQSSSLMQGFSQLYTNEFRESTTTSKETVEYFKKLSILLQAHQPEQRHKIVRKVITDLFSHLRRLNHPLPIAGLAKYKEQEQQFLLALHVKRCTLDCFQFASKEILDKDPISSIEFYLCRKGPLSSFELRHLEEMLDILKKNHCIVSQYMQFHFTRRIFYIALDILAALTSEQTWDTRALDWSKIQPSSIEAISLARKLEEDMKEFRKTLNIAPLFQTVVSNYSSLDQESQRVAYIYGLDMITWSIHTFNRHFITLDDDVYLKHIEKCPMIQTLIDTIEELCAGKAIKPVATPQRDKIAWANQMFTKINLAASQYKQTPQLASTYRKGYELYIRQTDQDPLFSKQHQLILPDVFDTLKIPTVPSIEIFEQTFPIDPIDIFRIFSSGENGLYQFLSTLTLFDSQQIKLLFRPAESKKSPSQEPASHCKPDKQKGASDYLPKSVLRFEEERKKQQERSKKGKKPRREHPKAYEKSTPSEAPSCSAAEKPCEDSTIPPSPCPTIVEDPSKPPAPPQLVVTATPVVKTRCLDGQSFSEIQLREALHFSRIPIHRHVRAAFERMYDSLDRRLQLDENLIMHTYPIVIAAIVQRYGHKKTIFSEYRQQHDDSYYSLGSIQKGTKKPIFGKFTEGFFSVDNRDGRKGSLFHHFFFPWTRQEITSFITQNAFESPERLEECQQDDLKIAPQPEELPGRYLFNIFRYRITLLDTREEILYTLAFPDGVPQL